jgi:hypothetical protein
MYPYRCTSETLTRGSTSFLSADQDLREVQMAGPKSVRLTDREGRCFRGHLVNFRRWAGTRRQELYGVLEVDSAELGLLFGLMTDYLEIEPSFASAVLDLADWGPA